ncbi:MAG: hypothetical protein MJY88_05490 [Bacteroidales bacterium]|nr:hypothetical protein [Bacteroidales bacterium]
MKRTYVKLSSEILMVETESSFMGASVVIKTVTVEPYKDGWVREGLTKDDGLLDDGTFGVTFD